MKIVLLLALGLCFVSVSAFADGNGFGVRGGLSWGYGEMENENKTIKTRDMNTIEVMALPGYRIADFLVGAFLDYRKVGQNTKPEEVNNQNLRGSGYLLGVGTSYSYSMLTFMGAVSFIGQHKLSNKDATGQEVVYKKPLGFHLGAGWQFMKSYSADLTVSSVKYSEDELNGTVNDVSTNKRSHWNAGLGISAYF